MKRVKCRMLVRLSLAALVLFGVGCASTEEEEPMIVVDVSSREAAATILNPGQPPTREPAKITVSQMQNLFLITAELDGSSPVERRIRMATTVFVEMVFRFDSQGWWVPKEFGFERSIVFDCPEIFRDPALVSIESGALDLASDQFPVLREIARLLRTELADREVFICGHLDAQEDAEELSLARARAVADFLVAHGVDRQRLEVVGFGSRYPMIEGNTVTSRRRNRRTEIVLKD